MYQAPPPNPAEQSRTKRGVIIAVVVVSFVVVALAVAGVVAFLLLADSSVDHPDEWDPRVADLATFIEDETGIDFDHPVHVSFLSPSEYRAAAGTDGEDAEEDREYADRQEAVYRALGMIQGEHDLVESNQAVWGEGTAAFFDTVEERVFVNGEVPDSGELTPEQRVTVVHELTHAWQHQHAETSDEDEWSTERADAELAVWEGDATVMEWSYASELTEAEFDELVRSSEASAGASDEALDAAGAGDLVPLLFSLPYQFGPSWVDLLLVEEGTDGILEALGPDVPTTAAIIGLDLDGGERVEVHEPELRSGSEEVERDTWGAFSWVVPLAAATDAATARAAVIGWTGDSVLISTTAEGVVCVDAAVELADRAGASAFEAAASTWLSQLPEGAGTEIDRDGQVVSLRTCDPGPDATVELAGDADAALAELALFSEIVSAVRNEGSSPTSAECVAVDLIETFGVERLNSDDLSAPSDAAEVDRIHERCG